MKIVSYNIILPLLALFMMFSCDEKTRVENESSNERITYSAEVAELEIAPMNKSGAESPTNEVISVCGDYALVLGSVTPMGETVDEVGTKGGTLTTDNIDQFRVLAYKHSPVTSLVGNFDASGNITGYGGYEIKKSGSVWSESTASQVKFWPNAPDKVNFYAYSTTSGWYTSIPSWVAGVHNPPKLQFNIQVSNNSQVDLLIAEAQKDKTYTTYSGSKIKFRFHHALASIGFEVFTHSHDKISSIAITGVVDDGQAKLEVLGTSPNQYIVWSDFSGAKSNVYEAGINNTAAALKNIMKDDGYLMLIPYDYDSDNPKIILTLKDGSSYEFPIKTTISANNKWVSGKRYIYRILPRYVEDGRDRGVGVPVNLGTDGAPIWRVFAPVNCGYIPANEQTINGNQRGYPYGKLYQWGRKHGHGYNLTFDADTSTITAGTISVAGAYTNPNIFYTNSSVSWCDPLNTYLWNNGTDTAPVKTIYDPCPNGWRVPTYDELVKLKVNASAVVTNGGIYGRWLSGGIVYDDSSQNYGAVFLPNAGRLTQNNKTPEGRTGANGKGYYWSSYQQGPLTHMLQITDNSHPTIQAYHSQGSSVRCVKEM